MSMGGASWTTHSTAQQKDMANRQNLTPALDLPFFSRIAYQGPEKCMFGLPKRQSKVSKESDTVGESELV